MASKYSNYELKPYVSTYTNPYSVEVNKILRERYDNNKASVDLIDKTLGSKQVLEGDQIHIDNAKGMVKNKFNKLTEFGDYENATLVVDEVMVGLESDKGLQYAQESFLNRQNELKYIQEATMQGFEMLDFGQFNASTHQSYTQDAETGAWTKNVYQPLSEKQHAYDQTIRGMIGTIRADASGVSQGKADRIAAGLLPGYLESFQGDQHFRKLTQIEGMSESDARSTILEQIESFTDQQVHYTAKASIKEQGKSNPFYSQYDPSKSKEGNPFGWTSDSPLTNHTLTMISQTGDVFTHNASHTTPEAINDKERLMRERTNLVGEEVSNAVKVNKITSEESDAFTKNMIDPYSGNATLTQWMLYQTQPRSVLEHFTEWEGAGPIDHTQQLYDAGLLTGGTWLGSTIYNSVKNRKTLASQPWYNKIKSGMKTKTAMKLFAVAYLGNELLEYTDKVTDPSNNKAGSLLRNLNEEGVFGMDSRVDVFESNMRKTKVLYEKGIMDKRNGTWQGEKGNQTFVYDLEADPCNCPFRNGDPFWEQHIKNGKASMLYMAEGGGEQVFETIENLGPIEREVSTNKTTATKQGLEAFKLNNNGLQVNHITDFNVHGYSEESDAWKDLTMIEGYDEDNPIYKQMEFIDLKIGGIDEGSPAGVYVRFGKENNWGNRQLIYDKKGKGMSYIENAFMNNGRPDLAAEASSFELLSRMENSNAGNRTYSRSGGITRHDELEVMTRNLYNIHQNFLSEEDRTKKDAYGNIMGPITLEGARNMANGIIQQKLKLQNEALFDEIDALYTDPQMNFYVKERVFERLYQQEFLRDNSSISLSEIVQ